MLVLLALILIASLPTGAVAQSENMWETKPSITHQGHVDGAVVVDGKIFFFRESSDLYAYDPSDGTCVQKADLQIPCSANMPLIG
jgi:hypothetical protein